MSSARRIVVALCALATVAAPVLAQPKKLPPAAPKTAAKTDNGNVDLAYSAFQRGFYLTALNEAAKRAKQNDPAAMTLLGEIYAQGLGVGRDDAKAAQWYKLAAAHGDRDAMFALAMFNFEGRGGPRNADEAARLLAAAAKLGHTAAAYDLGLLYLQGQQFPQDFMRAAELFRQAADAGNADAQYALATMYKEGRGVPKDAVEAARLMGLASVAGNIDAMVEFAIAQFNGNGTPKDEAAAARLFLIAARRGDTVPGAFQGAPRLRLPRRGRRCPRGRRQVAPLDRRSARRHQQFPARHSTIRHRDRA